MAENKGYMTLSDEQGSIHISEEVIAAIAVGAVREVEGVSGTMGTLGSSVADLVQAEGVGGGNVLGIAAAEALDELNLQICHVSAPP